MAGDRTYRIRLSSGDAARIRELGPADPDIRRWLRSLKGNTIELTARDIRVMLSESLRKARDLKTSDAKLDLVIDRIARRRKEI